MTDTGGHNSRLRFERYPEYKSSGVEWLGNIPVHWSLRRLKAVSALQTGLTLGKKYENDNLERRPYLRVANVQDGYLDLDEITEVELPAREVPRYELQPRDVLVTEGGDFDKLGRGYVWNGQIKGCLHQNHVFAVRPEKGSLDSGFLSSMLGSAYGRAYFTATSKQSTNLASTNSTKLGNFPLPLPSVDEQERVVSFLDRETRKIDALVAKKEELIELLQEKRTALITHAVTKGLDPNAPMKDSGIEWLGEIPAHWDSGALSRWWTVLDCKHRTVPFVNEGTAVASIGEVHDLTVDLSNAHRTTSEEYRQMITGGRDPRLGDIIYSRNATVGEAAIVDTNEPFCMGQDVSLIRSSTENPGFLLHVLRSRVVLSQLDTYMVGSTFKRINVGQIKKFFLAVPPAGEQEKIARFAQTTHDMTSRLIERIREGIDGLKELRTALISAAVTGRIDVRAASAEASAGQGGIP